MTATSTGPAPLSDFRLPFGQRVFSIVTVAILAVVTGIMMAFAVVVFATQWALGLFLALCAAFIGGLTGYTFRDLRGKLGLHIVFGGDAVTLHLPAWRSLIHRPPAQQLVVPYADIESIETRNEAYRSLGMASMQRVYVLRCKGDRLIFLFEERALATALASALYACVVTELLQRANVPLRELGTVEGAGGLLSVWGTHAPDWAAPSLPRDQALRLWRHAASTGALAFSLIIMLAAMRAFGG